MVNGSVQRGLGGVRLTLSLVDVRTLQQLGSALIDERTADFSSLEDAAVARLAKLLDVHLRPRDRARAESGVPAAYELYLKGVSFLQRYDKPGNLDAAMQQFQDAVGRDPSFALAYAKLGEAEWMKSRLTQQPALAQRALADCQKAAEINDQLAPVHVILGRIHSGSGNYDLAVEQFGRALQLNPRNSEAHQQISRAYESLGRTADAEASLKKAIALRPDYRDGYNSLGSFYMRRNNYRDAAAQFRKVVELTPDNSAGYSNLGAALNRLGDRAGAGAAFEKSIELAPSYAAYSNLSGLLYAEGKYEEAVRKYEEALKLNDRDYRPWYGLGLAERALGKAAEARPALERAAIILEPILQKNPNDAESVARLAFLYALLGYREKAQNRLENALALSPEDPSVLYQAATTNELLGDRAAAAKRLRQALERGYSKEEARRDPDWAGLRNDAAYARILK